MCRSESCRDRERYELVGSGEAGEKGITGFILFSIRDRDGMRVVFIVQYVSLEKVRIL